MIRNDINFTGSPIRVGKLVKEQRNQIVRAKALANLLEQTDKDYFNLTRAAKPQAPQKSTTTLAQGLKQFFDKGTMF